MREPSDPAAADRSAITLTALRYLVALADHGSFRRAAEACHVTQSTLSEQLQKLESILGTGLVERSRRVRLTASGQAVVEHARAILRELDALADDVGSDRAPLSGSFKLGVIPTLGPYFLPALLPALRASFSRLRLALHEALTPALLLDLVEHRLDAALLALPAALPGLVSRPLLSEPFFALLPRAHALASRSALRPEDLRGERLLLLTEGHCLRDQALALCDPTQHASAALDHDLRATSLETLTRLVAAGFGVTIVPALAQDQGPDVVARPLRQGANGSVARTLGLVWRKSHARPQDLAALCDLIVASRPPALTPAPGAPTPKRHTRTRRR